MKKYDIILEIKKLPEGYYLATSDDVQGLVAQGKTFEKTVKIAQDLAKKLLAMQKNYEKSDRIIYPSKSATS